MRRAALLLALLAPACTYIANTYVVADDAGAGSTATGGVGGALVDAGPDVVDAGDAACEPRECYATDPSTCERTALDWLPCDGGTCQDGGCVPGGCVSKKTPCEEPQLAELADAGWIDWQCVPFGLPAPSPWCVPGQVTTPHGSWCCPPEGDGGQE